jgi:membrane-bound lytic murein transglycosylase D
MPRKHVWLLGLAVAILGLSGCAPRFTAVVEEPPGQEVIPAAQTALANAGSVYQAGVDFFVAGQYDSAAIYLDSAVSMLSEDLNWAASGTILGERRLLLYKCRYFLERMPEPAAEPGVEPGLADLADIKPLKPQLPPIEIVDNDKVQKWLRYFNHDVRKNFQEWITRSGKYMPLTLRILKEEGMPTELTNLALIESGFNPNAYSRAHAAGIWQFIKSTGRLYGLRVDSYVDERRDPEKSCRAAARHLRDLYNMFNDWPLAMAAYNAGAGGVEKAMKRSRTSDYWRLSLKRETRDYVPMFMAAAIIMSDPGKYGFDCRYERPLEYEQVEVGAKTSLKAVARACQVEPGVIAELNPHLIKHCTAEAGSGSLVRIPKEKVDLFAAEFARIPREERVAKASVSADGRHTVRRGETLSKIAKKYGTTVEALAQANNIKNRHRLGVGQVLAVPGGETVAAASGSVPENPSTHTVRKGETLSGISRKYGIGLSDLLAWNDIRSNDLLHPGQKLIVSGSKASREKIIVHKVRRGDTINTIAQKYGASTSTVLKTNGLRAKDKIYPGQRIKVPVKAST